MNEIVPISEADEQALLDSIDRWLEKKVAPVAARYEQADEYPRELVEDMCEMGLFGALIEPQYGGPACRRSPIRGSWRASPKSG